MKIAEKVVTVERGGDAPEESFAIGNLGRILTVLRSKMYSNPIRSICREISCNARDAHREVGTPELPIEIHLPHALDSHYKIKDFGPGITPHRMSNVFLQYGNSTKDDSNDQTGGFGLGAKTPFAYADSFSVITVTPNDDGDGNIKRVYTAYVDESHEGKMRLSFVQDTDEPCGTEICILVQENDWHRFEEETVRETRFWEVHPKLTGKSPSPEYPEEPAPMIESETWSVMPPAEGYYENRTSRAIVDGIAYNIDIGSLNLEDGSDLLRRGVRMTFAVGELSLTANREQLDYDAKAVPDTKAAIEKRLAEIKATAIARLEEKLADAGTFTEATRVYVNFKKVLECALPKGFVPLWQGHKCHSLQRGTRDIENLTVQRFFLKSDRNGDTRVFKEDVKHVSLDTDTCIFLNDLTRVNVPRDRVRKILEEKKEDGISTVHVLTFKELQFEEGMEDDLLSLLDVTNLSTIPRAPRVRAPRGSRKNKANAYEFDASYTDPRRNCDKKWLPVDIDRKDGEGYYVVVEGHKESITSNGRRVSRYDIENLEKFLDDTVYGVKVKDADKLGKGWVPLMDGLTAALKDRLEELGMTIEEVGQEIHRVRNTREHRLSSQMSWLHKIVGKCIDEGTIAESSLLRQFYELSSTDETTNREYSALWDLSEHVQPAVHQKLVEEAKKEEDPVLKKMWDRVQERYPLLQTLDYYSWRIERSESAGVIHYIQMVDANEERKATEPKKPLKRSMALKRSVAMKGALKRSVALGR